MSKNKDAVDVLMIVKTFEFEAAHYLPNYDGACANLHGHSYKLEIGVTRVDEKEVGLVYSDMIIDFKELKQIINKAVILRYDHKNLNDIITEKNPTAETLVYEIRTILAKAIPQYVKLSLVRLWETSTSYAEWRVV